jgi:hypothetical protein
LKVHAQPGTARLAIFPAVWIVKPHGITDSRSIKAKTAVEDILGHNWIVIGTTDRSFTDSNEALQVWYAKAIVFDPTFYQFYATPSTNMKITWAFDECLNNAEFLTLSPTSPRESLIGRPIRVRVFVESVRFCASWARASCDWAREGAQLPLMKAGLAICG